MRTLVETFAFGIHHADPNYHSAKTGSDRLMQIAREADEMVAALGDIEIIDIADSLYSVPDDCPIFMRRVAYRRMPRQRRKTK